MTSRYCAISQISSGGKSVSDVFIARKGEARRKYTVRVIRWGSSESSVKISGAHVHFLKSVGSIQKIVADRMARFEGTEIDGKCSTVRLEVVCKACTV